MELLFFIGVGAGILFLLRRQLMCISVDWRSMAGFVCGAIVGVIFSIVTASETGKLVKETGVPLIVFRILYVVIWGVAAAKPVREILEDAFPSGRKRKGNNDVTTKQ